VRQAWVAGRHLLRDGQPTGLDFDEILDEARYWGRQIQGAS
jgi:hypothetical protein